MQWGIIAYNPFFNAQFFLKWSENLLLRPHFILDTQTEHNPPKNKNVTQTFAQLFISIYGSICKDSIKFH